MTLVSGNEFDIKIGYNKRAAAKRDLTVVLQDVEGVTAARYRCADAGIGWYG